MAYLSLILSVVYFLAWSIGMFYSFKTPGKRALWVPVFGILFFIGFGFYSLLASQVAMSNPPQLTAEAYNGVAVGAQDEEGEMIGGMSRDEVHGALGVPVDPTKLNLDLAEMGVSVPGEVGSRLMGEQVADATGATMTINFFGEPWTRRSRDTLGASAKDEKNGLKDLVICLKDGENEQCFTEGEDWEYEKEQTVEDVAATVAELIDATDEWVAEGSTDDNPHRITISHESEEKLGIVGNSAECVVATGPNTAVRLRRHDAGEPQQFKGGQDEVRLEYFYEPDIIMDANFSMTDRLVLVGFINDLAAGKVASGLGPVEDYKEKE